MTWAPMGALTGTAWNERACISKLAALLPASTQSTEPRPMLAWTREIASVTFSSTSLYRDRRS
jgi:hypothetical protein